MDRYKLCKKYPLFNWIDDKIFWYIYDVPKNKYLSIKHWFYSNWNKYHFNLLKKAFFSYGWDYSYMYKLEYAQIEKALYWFEKQRYHDTDKTELTVRTLRLAKYLLGMMITDGNELWESEGEFGTIDNGNGTHTLTNGTYKHIYIGPYVNTRNGLRFVNERMLETIVTYGHYEELYVAKCKKLYHRLMEQYMEYWWD